MATDTQEIRQNRYSSKGIHACPKCRGDLYRIRRRTVDRVVSLFAPVQRFRCHFFSCHWEGNIRVARKDFDDTDARVQHAIDAPPSAYARERRLPRSFVVHMVFVAVGLVAVFLVATTDWWADPEPAQSWRSDDQWVASARLTRDGESLGRSADAAKAVKPAAATGQR